MRSIAGGIVTTALVGLTAAAAQTAEDAFGVWEHPENKSHVEIYKCGDGLCARIVKVVDGQKTDDKNPNEALRKRPIIGLVIMSGAKKTGPGQWQGSLYNRADGATYTGTLTVKSKDALDLQGCTAVVFCKTVTWKRVK
ncbi:MAG TPA: DUF2147 domain-containing protein [Hyphomicrobiaceae bacterium]|nr:DUF2147 domain-containing protein [Hyphomicrobiaceae bacterium]